MGILIDKGQSNEILTGNWQMETPIQISAQNNQRNVIRLSLRYLQKLAHEHLKYVWNVYGFITNHEQDLQPQKTMENGRNLSVIDCSQPSIFLHFYSIFERADRIARKLDASE